VLPLFLVETWNLFKDKLGVYKSRAAIYAGCSFLLFGLGFVFCYFILLPTTMQYLIGLGEEVAKPIITVHDYVSLVVFMFLAMGLAFQAPIVLLVLEHLGLIERNMLAKNRRVVIVVILVIAAIVTPTPDPMSQIIMATPMYLLFEFALLLMKRN
jgi:sec-independent protein translocase protein TatC